MLLALRKQQAQVFGHENNFSLFDARRSFVWVCARRWRTRDQRSF
jgi:hypothetical protein